MHTLILAAPPGADSFLGPALIIGLGLLGVAIAIALLISKLMVVGNPSEMLVISGRRSAQGQGYRTLIGGRTLVIPIIEKVSRISLRNMQVGLEVSAQSGGGKMIPVTVTGVANVKVSSEPDLRGNAIERFLGEPMQELQRVARETLEGGLRAVIGKMTPEEIVEDRDKFVATVMREVTDDFRKLGLTIDSVNIQNVHDAEQYLESIARKASAEVRASARQYEAQKKADADIKEAEADAMARKARADRDSEARSAEAAAHQRAESARLAAEQSIAEAENALRIRRAELAREAELKEAETQKAAAAKEEARLVAAQVKPAIAARDVAKAKAEGDAALIMEEGKARAAAIETIGKAIQAHPDALKVMLAEMMPTAIREITKTVANVELGSVTVIDGDQGRAISGAAMGRARMISESLATLEAVMGIDLRRLAHSIAGNLGGGDGKQDTPAASAHAATAPPKKQDR
ncbi:MAG TPA: SPFH domain-containing protein [Phycisphaerae bacterium]|nr:SPFH domain-containing protein [Phycisphaerae bacterium]HRR84300.1 SPFH domain-containing protein [Phycisphaerae bacterium]